MCLMCNVDVEHLIHVFFDYTFAKSCYHDASLSFDVSQVLSTPERLLSKLKMSSRAESVKLLTVLVGYLV